MPQYRGLISSDWSECLSPSGPFDVMSFVYPELTSDLAAIFKQYTGNEIALSEAMKRCHGLLPAPVSAEQMDAYLDEQFAHYTGVPELIETCLSRNILFMINTTGSMGYFQRVFCKKLLPRVSALSAHPGLTFSTSKSDPEALFDLQEITDKPVNTAIAAKHFQISPQNILVMGDSGGDGPHFKWAADQNAIRVASMAKPSLKLFCAKQEIGIDHYFGISYEDGELRREADEMLVDFRDLLPYITDRLATSDIR
ncbi:hypothetical protein ACFL2E_06120 [Thermodesulfobacteriota bacterium]